MKKIKTHAKVIEYNYKPLMYPPYSTTIKIFHANSNCLLFFFSFLLCLNILK